MEKYNVGDIWWVHFPFKDANDEKRRPAIVIDEDTIAILTLYVTSQNKDNPYSIEITDWRQAGLAIPSWARVDRIVSVAEWRMSDRIGSLSQNDLLKILQLVAEISTNIFHEFSLVAIKREDGKFLQKYDKDWKCWLFPYYRTMDNNMEYIENQIEKEFGIKNNISYVTVGMHCKYSVRDKVYKRYKHKLYKVDLKEISANMRETEFELSEIRYRWMSIEEMEQSQEIMDKNDDIVAFIKKNIE